MKILKFLCLIFGTLLMFAACTQDSDLSSDKSTSYPVELRGLEESNLPILKLENEHGIHVFDLSDFERGNYSKTSGFITIDGKVYKANVNLSDEYLSSICLRENDKGYDVIGLNDGSDLSHFTVEESSNNSVNLIYESDYGDHKFVLQNGTLPMQMLELSGNFGCDDEIDQRWIQVAIAAITLIGTVGCGIANSVGSGNCASVAASCPNGVATYIYGGGLCGNSVCNVNCN